MIVGALRSRFASPTTLVFQFFMHWGLADEEARRMGVVESAAGASSSRDVAIVGGTADSVVADEDTTEDVEIT